MREIRTLRAMRRELETELRCVLIGHEGGNPGHSQGFTYEPPRQFSTLPIIRISMPASVRSSMRGTPV